MKKPTNRVNYSYSLSLIFTNQLSLQPKKLPWSTFKKILQKILRKKQQNKPQQLLTESYRLHVFSIKHGDIIMRN